MSKAVDPSTQEPTDRALTFAPPDTVYASCQVVVPQTGLKMQARWYKASAGDDPVVTTDYTADRSGSGWVSFRIQSNSGALPTGSDWRVDILVNGQVVKSARFTVATG